MRSWIAIVVLAACSHSKQTAQTPPPSAGASCDQLAHHLLAILPANDGSKTDFATAFVSVVQERCTADGWTAEARQCINDAREMKDADRCQPLLTEAQVAAVGKAMDEKLKGMHPADGAGAVPTGSGAPGGGGVTPTPESTGAEPPAPPPPPNSSPKTRGPQPKGGKNGKTGDPCEGGE
jgi:hypothetical protein